jgi:hypothetical protein
VLLKDYITLLPANQTVVEILESVEPDALVIAACQRMKEAGYLIALDDFDVGDPREVLTDFADIIKVDIKHVSPKRQAEMINATVPGAAVCWPKRSRLAKTSWPPVTPGSCTFRDIFSAVQRSLPPTKFPRTV